MPEKVVCNRANLNGAKSRILVKVHMRHILLFTNERARCELRRMIMVAACSRAGRRFESNPFVQWSELIKFTSKNYERRRRGNAHLRVAVHLHVGRGSKPLDTVVQGSRVLF